MATQDLTNVVSGARKTMKDFQRALKKIKKVQIRELQKSGRRQFKKYFKRFVLEIYVDETRRKKKIEPYGEAWGKRKKRLGLRLERGQANRGVYKTIRSPRAFQKLQDGFLISLFAPNLTILAKVRLSKSEVRKRNKARLGRAEDRRLAGTGVRGEEAALKQLFKNQAKVRKPAKERRLVNDYIEDFASEKAPGLGTLAESDIRNMTRQIEREVRKVVAQVEGAAKSLSKKFSAELSLEISRMELT